LLVISDRMADEQNAHALPPPEDNHRLPATESAEGEAERPNRTSILPVRQSRQPASKGHGPALSNSSRMACSTHSSLSCPVGQFGVQSPKAAARHPSMQRLKGAHLRTFK
jgi:hypothetical protein